ncbi:MAG: cob(I)yrinic acid a,c-diamide adenosyltransferase [Bacilli bacterium]|jgi:cob(I)alamin adenosyltransferase|nr:cob(I)yrinic acid a,c-diamide adenosyltransferase [Patescibacteria group bacterium]
MYYTGKGDDGTSNLLNPKIRIIKSDYIFEVLGSLDELNSWLGLCAVEAKSLPEILEIVKNIQNQLFICQAYFAEAKVVIDVNLITATEEIIDRLSKLIKPKKSFILSGGSKLSVLFDVARTLARKTERRALQLQKIDKRQVNSLVLAYLNRLSSLLYVLARFVNELAKQEEEEPKY